MRIAVYTVARALVTIATKHSGALWRAGPVAIAKRRADDKIYIAANLPFRTGNNSYNPRRLAEVSGFARARARIESTNHRARGRLYVRVYADRP